MVLDRCDLDARELANLREGPSEAMHQHHRDTLGPCERTQRGWQCRLNPDLPLRRRSRKAWATAPPRPPAGLPDPIEVSRRIRHALNPGPVLPGPRQRV